MSTDFESAREMGQMQERLRSLDSKFGDVSDRLDSMAKKIDTLNEKISALSALSERSKGMYMGAMGLASAAGAAATWLAGVFTGKHP
jgi:phage shock protein A